MESTEEEIAALKQFEAEFAAEIASSKSSIDSAQKLIAKFQAWMDERPEATEATYAVVALEEKIQEMQEQLEELYIEAAKVEGEGPTT